jgi:hypothetical protein
VRWIHRSFFFYNSVCLIPFFAINYAFLSVVNNKEGIEGYEKNQIANRTLLRLVFSCLGEGSGPCRKKSG